MLVVPTRAMPPPNPLEPAKRVPANDGDAPALSPVPGCDPDWKKRIERAKWAREEGRKAREGKPMVFSSSRTLILERRIEP